MKWLKLLYLDETPTKRLLQSVGVCQSRIILGGRVRKNVILYTSLIHGFSQSALSEMAAQNYMSLILFAVTLWVFNKLSCILFQCQVFHQAVIHNWQYFTQFMNIICSILYLQQAFNLPLFMHWLNINTEYTGLSALSCHRCLSHRLIKMQQRAVFTLCVTHSGYELWKLWQWAPGTFHTVTGS